jgi:hypothetical protein
VVSSHSVPNTDSRSPSVIFTNPYICCKAATNYPAPVQSRSKRQHGGNRGGHRRSLHRHPPSANPVQFTSRIQCLRNVFNTPWSAMLGNCDKCCTTGVTDELQGWLNERRHISHSSTPTPNPSGLVWCRVDFSSLHQIRLENRAHKRVMESRDTGLYHILSAGIPSHKVREQQLTLPTKIFVYIQVMNNNNNNELK